MVLSGSGYRAVATVGDNKLRPLALDSLRRLQVRRARLGRRWRLGSGCRFGRRLPESWRRGLLALHSLLRFCRFHARRRPAAAAAGGVVLLPLRGPRRAHPPLRRRGWRPLLLLLVLKAEPIRTAADLKGQIAAEVVRSERVFVVIVSAWTRTRAGGGGFLGGGRLGGVGVGAEVEFDDAGDVVVARRDEVRELVNLRGVGWGERREGAKGGSEGKRGTSREEKDVKPPS